MAGGLELSPTGSAAASVGSWGLSLCKWEVKGQGQRRKEPQLFFKPSGLTVTLSESGQEKKCRSFGVD